jgi:hypothetical protein
VGRHLVSALSRGRAQVTVLSRRPGPGTRTWDDLPELLGGADAVINLCGESIAGGRWTPERRRLLAQSRVEPTQRLVRAMAQAPARPRVLVNASAVGIYGPLDERSVDEAQAPGRDFLAQVCARWEAAADDAAGLGVRVVKLRTGVVLARDGGALPRMALPVRLFQGAVLGSGRQGLSWIHVDDLVQLIQRAAADPDWQGPVNATAPVPVSHAAFMRALARRLRRPLLPLPGWLTGAAVRGLLGEMGRALLLEGAYVRPGRAEQLGFAFRFPELEAALEDLYPPG